MRLLEPDQIFRTQSMVAIRETSQIGQPFIPLCVKYRREEFQSIQQFWQQLDIVSKKIRELKMVTSKSEASPSETRNWRLFCSFFWGGGGLLSVELIKCKS